MMQSSQTTSIKKKESILTYFLLGLLIVSSFLIGSLYTKVQILEKSLSGKDNSQKVAGIQVAANEGNQPVPSVSPTISFENSDIKLAKDDHINGNKNARIILFEYSDMECPFCKKFHPTAQQIVDTYKGQVSWVYRHFPLSLHANAQKEAEASECANDLGGNTAFWKYVNTLTNRTSSGGTGFALADLAPLAKEIGLKEAKFKTCLDSGKYGQRVKDDIEEGSRLGISGTPGNILLDTKTGKSKVMQGAYPFENFKQVIDEIINVY